MATEILNLEVKADIKSATQDMDALSASLKTATQREAELTVQIKIQEGVLIDIERELIELKSIQDSMPKGAWWQGQSELNAKIKERTSELNLEKVALKDLQNQQKDNNADLIETKANIDGITTANAAGTPISRAAAFAVKGIGTALKAMGIGLIIAALLLLKKAFMSNATVMKAVQKITNVVSNLFDDLVGVFKGVYTWVKNSGKEFNTLKQGMKDIVTIALTPMKVAFYGIKLAAEALMLKWYELQEVFGSDKASESVKRLKEAIAETKGELGGVATEAVGAVKNLYVNAGEMVNEFGRIVKKTVKETSKIKIRTTRKTNQDIIEDDKKTSKTLVDNEEAAREAWRQRMRDAIKEEQELRKAGAEALKELQQENLVARLGMLVNEIEAQKEQALELLRIQYEKDLLEIEQYENTNELKKELDEKYLREKGEAQDIADERRKEKEQELADFKRDLMMQGLAIIGQGLQIQANVIEKNYNDEIKLAEAQGKSTEGIEAKYDEKRKANAKKQKALKIGMAIIDTYQSAIAAYAAALQLGLPGLVLAPISAGLAITAGLANIAMIAQQDVGGGGGGGGGSSAAPKTQAEPPSPEMMSGTFQLEGGQEVEPVQAYVVSDDITESQNALAIIRRRATI